MVTGELVPTWYWAATGALVFGFIAAVETHQPWVVTVGSIGYAAGLTALGGVGLAVGGPLLMRYLRRLMSRRLAGGRG